MDHYANTHSSRDLRHDLNLARYRNNSWAGWRHEAETSEVDMADETNLYEDGTQYPIYPQQTICEEDDVSMLADNHQEWHELAYGDGGEMSYEASGIQMDSYFNETTGESMQSDKLHDEQRNVWHDSFNGPSHGSTYKRNPRSRKRRRSSFQSHSMQNPSKKKDLMKKHSSPVKKGKRKKDVESEHTQKQLHALFNDQVVGLYQKSMGNEVLGKARTASDQLVKFRFDECPTYKIQLKRGDRLLLFIDHQQISKQALFATHARFIQAFKLTPAEQKLYLSCLMNEKKGTSLEVLNIIEQCPAPWRFILDSTDLEQDTVLDVLNVSNAVAESPVTKHVRTCRQFFRQFVGTAFIPGPLTAALRTNLTEGVIDSNKVQPQSTAYQLFDSCKCFAESIARYAPEVLPKVVPLIQLLVDHKIPTCDISFLMSLLKLAVSHHDDPANTHWSKLQLLVTSSELKSTEKANDERMELGSTATVGFLPCVRIHGPYPGVDNYMDTNIRLLREDRLSSLRNALAALQRGAFDSKDLCNVPILPHIKMTGIQMTHSSNCLAVVVKTQTGSSDVHKSMIKHARSKLMRGNLVAFIVDGNFDEILYATIETIFQSQSLIMFSATFLSDPGSHSRSNGADVLTRLFYAKDLIAAINPAYYRAFSPLMVSLHKQNQDFLPFKEEFVFLNSNEAVDSGYSCPSAGQPAVMSKETAVTMTEVEGRKTADVINDDIQHVNMRENQKLEMMEDKLVSDTWSSECSPCIDSSSEDDLLNSIQQVCIFEKSSKYKHNRLPSYLQKDNVTMSWTDIFTKSLKNPDSPDPGYWTSSKAVEFDTLRKTYKSSLDESQLDAVELALHNRVAVIEGPPGTGKTLIGFRLAQILLSVSSLPDGPILVLSYKNHALNEFLAGCRTFCSENKVVRVGGQKAMLRNTGVTHLKDMCPHLRLRHFPIPDEFSRLKGVVELVPLFVEFMPMNELRNMAMMNDRACEQTFRRFHEQNLREQLMNVVNTMSKVYCTNLSLKDKAKTDVCPFVRIVQALYKVLIGWLEDETSFQEFLIKRHVLQSPDQNLISTISTAYLSKTQREKQRSKKNSPLEVEDDEDEEYELMELKQRDLDPIHDVEKELMKTVVELSITSPVSDDHKNQETIFAVDLARVEPSKSTIDDLNHTLSCIHLKDCMKPDNLAHVIKTLAQLKWKASTKAVMHKSRELSEAFARVEEKQIHESAELLKKVKIVGMTTDGAAINHELLSQLKPSVVIIEEAAEILEVQVLAVLSASVQHLILIGDHKQLRPPVENHELRKKNKFDVSLLERLVNNNHPHVSLTHQGRMLPMFVPLLEPIYNNLQTNFDAIKNNQPAACVSKPMYFWSHAYPETKEGTSFYNTDEAHMLFNMVLWCILQNKEHRIHPSKITVISMYAAQVKFIRKLVKDFQDKRSDLADQLLGRGQTVRAAGQRQRSNEVTSESTPPLIRVCTVDQYQGDENEYVFVSLVRSNAAGKLGHVAIQNRMCVSCSRSRSGLYIFGNADCLRRAKNAPHWTHALKYCTSQDCLGTSVPLQCPRHPAVTFEVSRPEDFKIQYHNTAVFLSTLCKEKCGQMMKCGKHHCLEDCHPHFEYEECNVLVDVVLSCGHPHECPCWQSTSPILWKFKCEEQCERTINCPRRHECPRRCGDRCPTFRDCTICERLELDRRQREAQRKQAVAKKIKETITTETKQLQKEEQHCSVTLLQSTDNLEVQLKIRTVENIVFSCGRVSDNSRKNSELKLISCWEITNLTQVRKFVSAYKMLKQCRQAHLQCPYMALVVPSTCDDVNQFIKSVADHGVQITQTSFGKGIFLTHSPGHSCLLDGAGPYDKTSSLAHQSFVTLIICQVALGHRLNRQPNPRELRRPRSIPPVCQWGHQSVSMHNESGSKDRTTFQVTATDQVLPAYIACCERVENCLTLKDKARKTGRTQSIMLYKSDKITSNDECEKHFNIVESKFLRHIAATQLCPGSEVIQAEYIVNPKLLLAYEKTKEQFKAAGKPTDEQYGFHGTTAIAIEKIFEEGFKIGGKNIKRAHGNAYGTGVYLATNPRTSQRYSEGHDEMIMAQFLAGKYTKHLVNDFTTNDFDSYMASDIVVTSRSEQVLPLYRVQFKIG